MCDAVLALAEQQAGTSAGCRHARIASRVHARSVGGTCQVYRAAGHPRSPGVQATTIGAHRACRARIFRILAQFLSPIRRPGVMPSARARSIRIESATTYM